MNYFDYFNNFWLENEREPFSTSEIALFHFLLYEGNRQRWKMPLRCSTAMIAYRLKTTKQNILKARDALSDRGIISYEKGSKTDSPARYLLLHSSDSFTTGQVSQLAPQSISQLTTQLTPQLTSKLTTEDTSELTKPLAHINNNTALPAPPQTAVFS